MSFYPAALAAAPKSPSGDGFFRVLAGACRVPGYWNQARPVMNEATLWNHNRYALNGRAAPAILAGDDDFMTAALQRLREITEAAVGLDACNRFSINNQCRIGLGTPDQLDDIAVPFGGVHLESHFLRFVLRH